MSTPYYTLVASLPHMPDQFEGARLPINRQRLAQRLTMLAPNDAAMVARIESFLAATNKVPETSDEKFLRLFEEAEASIHVAVVREYVRFRIDNLTIIANLRRRQLDLPPYERGEGLASHVRRYWNHVDFRLGASRPWVAAAAQLLADGDALGMEKLMIANRWAWLHHARMRYHFTIEAVAVYLLQWHLLDRWTRQDPDAGRARFDELVTETLGSHADN